METERSSGTNIYLVYTNLLCYKCKWSLWCALHSGCFPAHSPCHLIPKDTGVKQSLGLVSGLRKATAPVDFSTQQVWMVMSGRAYSTLWCKLISFVFTRRGAFFIFSPPFTLLRVAQIKHVALLSARRTAAEGEYRVVVHCLEKGMCQQQQTSVLSL